MALRESKQRASAYRYFRRTKSRLKHRSVVKPIVVVGIWIDAPSSLNVPIEGQAIAYDIQQVFLENPKYRLFVRLLGQITNGR